MNLASFFGCIDENNEAFRQKTTSTKAKLLKEGILFPHPVICQRHFVTEKVGNQ